MIAVYVLATVMAVTTVVFVLALCVWAARKDGEADRAVRAETTRRP